VQLNTDTAYCILAVEKFNEWNTNNKIYGALH
jgi:hypothetical protein